MIRMLLPGTPSREDGRSCFVWLSTDAAEVAAWLRWRTAFEAATAVAEADEVCFWDGQTILADVVEVDEDVDIAEVEFLEDEKDYTESENMPVAAMRAHVDDEGIYWSWWAKHSNIRYTSTKLLWVRLSELRSEYVSNQGDEAAVFDFFEQARTREQEQEDGVGSQHLDNLLLSCIQDGLKSETFMNCNGAEVQKLRNYAEKLHKRIYARSCTSESRRGNDPPEAQ